MALVGHWDCVVLDVRGVWIISAGEAYLKENSCTFILPLLLWYYPGLVLDYWSLDHWQCCCIGLHSCSTQVHINWFPWLKNSRTKSAECIKTAYMCTPLIHTKGNRQEWNIYIYEQYQTCAYICKYAQILECMYMLNCQGSSWLLAQMYILSQ